MKSFIVIVLFLCITVSIDAQIKSKKFSITSMEELYFQAVEKRTTDPTTSISLLDQLINKAKDKRNTEMLMDAYVLLAKINMDSGLIKLAVTRFEQALQIAKVESDKYRIGSIQYEIGILKNGIKDKSAIPSFRECMKYSIDGELYYQCYEGLGIALMNADSLNRARTIFSELEVKYKNESAKDLARVQSLLTQVDIQRNDLAGAKLNFSNSRENYKRSNAVDDELAILDSTSELLIDKDSNVDDEISIRAQNIELNTQAPGYQSQEQIKLADAYIRKGEIDNASSTIDEAREFVVAKGDVKTKAAFYKQSSDVFAKKGEYARALKEYQAYEEEHSKIISQKEKDLEKRISLLESQKKIDISENVYSSNARLGASERQVFSFQRYVIYLLIALLLTALIAGWWILKSLRSKNIANKQLELKSLRGQMNPHFIFNALNSVNEFIATQNPRKANQYLSKFSKLMRSVLDVNMKDLIPLAEELEITKDYLELEHARFEDKFEYVIDIEGRLLESDLVVPPLLLQPYIENSIWHGLRYRDSKGKLVLKANQINEEIIIRISDDGIGRKKSLESKTKHQKKHKSAGMKNTSERIAIVQELYGKKFSVNVTNLNSNEEHPGTLVEFKISKY